MYWYYVSYITRFLYHYLHKFLLIIILNTIECLQLSIENKLVEICVIRGNLLKINSWQTYIN